MIEIQHGCIKDLTQKNTYIYVDAKLHAYLRSYEEILKVDSQDNTYIFHVEDGQKPEIGDFIEHGKLVKRTKPKVNNDWSRWKDKDL